MEILLYVANHSVVSQPEPPMPPTHSIGYLMFQWAYLLLMLFLLIMVVMSVFNIFKPKPKVYQDEKEDYLSSNHFKKYL